MMKWQQGIHRGEGNKMLHLVVSEANQLRGGGGDEGQATPTLKERRWLSCGDRGGGGAR